MSVGLLIGKKKNIFSLAVSFSLTLERGLQFLVHLPLEAAAANNILHPQKDDLYSVKLT